ncbi:MAG: hypothetical protein ACRC0R_02705, partial [Cetobacterium sp.]
MDGILEKLPKRKIGSFGDPNDYLNKTEYKLSFWKTVYSGTRVKSMVANDTLFGELNHPKAEHRDRDIDLSKVSHRINNFEFRDTLENLIAVIGSDGEWVSMKDDINYDKAIGTIYADIDILDTPLGKILHTYFKCKANIGFSSRADGDASVNRDGVKVISNYRMFGIDAVLIPSKSDSRIIDESSEYSLVDECVKVISRMDTESKYIVEGFISMDESGYMDDIMDRAFGEDSLSVKKSDFRRLEMEYKKLRDEKLESINQIE